MGFLSVGNLPYVMDSVGEYDVVHTEEVTAISSTREFYCLRKSPDSSNNSGIRARSDGRSATSFSTWIRTLPRVAPTANVVTALGNWRKLSVKQKVRAIGDRVFVEKDRLLGSALTCTGLTRRNGGEKVARDDAPVRRHSIPLPRRNWRYPKVLFRMNVIDREMDRRGCYWNISIKAERVLRKRTGIEVVTVPIEAQSVGFSKKQIPLVL